ncbi:MAG: SDR family oxidoreductase [bacterium]
MIWDNTDLFCRDLPTRPQPEIGKILVTGATGYIGGRLVPELQARGYEIRVMVRMASPEHVERWPDVDIVVADALDFNNLTKALEGIHTAYYLIHSLLLGQKRFESADIQAAMNFRKAAEEKNVKRIIYLGGLGDIRTPLSPHLSSRIKVAEEFKRGKVPVTILRAAIVIGSGSAPYEIIKHVVKNSPIIFVPDWLKTKCQPIGIRDVVKYLVGVLETTETCGKSFDIGGSDILTLETILKKFANILGKKILFLPSPINSIGFYAYITSLITPIPSMITWSLFQGCKNEVICQNDEIKRVLPFQPISYKEALLRAMSREEQDNVHTRWSDTYPPAHELAIKLHELTEPPNYISSYSLLTEKSASSLFSSICKIGGKSGWFKSNFLWGIRGMIDRILLGVGLSRGRRNSSSLRINDVIDFWRVENLKPNEMLLLRAEMKLPGRAWLEFRIDQQENKNRLSVTAYFQSHKFLGKVYWYVFLPFHNFIFNDLIKQIEKRS